MVTDRDAFAGAHLVLPLTRHHLGIGPRQFDSSVQTRAVIHVRHNSSVAIVCSHRAIVGSLRGWVPIQRPSKGLEDELGLGLDHNVLLLDAVPRLFRRACFKDWPSVCSEIGVCRLQLLVSPRVFKAVSFAQHEKVVPFTSSWASEGVLENRYRFQYDLRALGGSLVARRTIIVPLRHVFHSKHPVRCVSQSPAL